MMNTILKAVRVAVFFLAMGFLLRVELIGAEWKDPMPKTDEERLQGDWVLMETTAPNGTVTVHKPGQPDTNHFNLYFQKNRVIIHFDGTDPNDEVVMTFTMNSSKTPKQIDFVGLGSTIPTYKATDDQSSAIYRLEGDTLLLAWPIGSKKNRPTDFKPDEKKQIPVYKFIRSKTPIA